MTARLVQKQTNSHKSKPFNYVDASEIPELIARVMQNDILIRERSAKSAAFGKTVHSIKLDRR